MDNALDPYEQQLLKVFNSHDRDNRGSLDAESLTRLCQTLQLEEQGVELVQCLVHDKHSRTTFADFKNALLALLGNMQNGDHHSTKPSPDREVSPKLVYGSKKYGRRSRPKHDEMSANECRSPGTVQRSNSQSEVSSKKRRTNHKLKRCASLPGHAITSLSEPELVCTEEMLREAWKKLGVGEDGHLDQNELVMVCDAIGLHKLADGVIRQLSDQLAADRHHQISFQELLAILQRDDTWFEVLNEPPPALSQPTFGPFPDSRTFHLVTLGPDGDGVLQADQLVEMWESVGVPAPRQLLLELGLEASALTVSQLAEALDRRLRGARDAARSPPEKHSAVALLQASVALYQSEIRTLRGVWEQMRAEREKLRCDVAAANDRAALLAQEVDDNHSRMERSTMQQVRQLEQRHADVLRETSAQFARDKEKLSSANRALEEKIRSLEQELGKLRADLVAAQKYSIGVEGESRALAERVGGLERDKAELGRQIESLEAARRTDGESALAEGRAMAARLAALRLENARLQDTNDEMASEIESLAAGLRARAAASSTPRLSLERSMEENVSGVGEGVGVVGGKRRGGGGSPEEGGGGWFDVADGSPRLGKIRKFHNIQRENLDVPFASSESGFDVEADSISSEENDNVRRLRSKIAFLEQILVQNGIPLPGCDIEKSGASTSTNTNYLSDRVKLLEMVISEINRALTKMIEKDNLTSDDIRNIAEKIEKSFFTQSGSDHFHEVSDKLSELPIQNCTTVSCQTDLMDNFEEKVSKLEDENKELCAKCSELENCVELLRNEYEKCEDYWQNKVDEERQIFDAEQKINSDKLSELLLKMKEYEEQYANQDQVDNRLPTIEETYNLEKQFTDLEQEFDTYKEQSGLELMKKDEEIALLKEKLTELALRQQGSVQIQAEAEESRILNKMQSLSSHVIENSSLISEENGPSTVISPPPNNLDYVNQSMGWHQANTNNDPENFVNPKSLPVDWNFTNNTKASSSAPTSSSSSTCFENNSTPCTPCRPKRTRKFDKNIYNKNNQEKDVKKAEIDTQPRIDSDKGFQNISYCHPGQSVFMPLRSFHNLNARRNYLEQRVRHLQVCLKQQHYCNEQTLQHYWLQFSSEKTDLHARLKYLQDKLDQQVRISRDQLEKLERTDMLVKDLYIENAYLIANVQRLEQRCHMLAQCNSSSV